MKKVTVMKLLAAMMLVVGVIVGCNRDNVLREDVFPVPDDSRLITFSSEVVPDQYIVVLKPELLPAGLRSAAVSYEEAQLMMADESRRILASHQIDAGKVAHVYGHALKGFAVSNLSEAEVKELLKSPEIAYIEQDQVIALQGGPPGGGGGSCASGSSQTVPCGITVVGGGANYTGGKKAYVLDTGIDLDHPDLNVATYGFNAFTSGPDGNTLDDLNGHGSHVSGTIAAKNNSIGVVGVAAGALLVPVKVLNRNGSGTTAGVIAGVNYVGANGASGDVANMSLGGSVSQSLDDAVLAASSGGIWFILAAGNSSAHAGNYSPSRVNGTYVRTISAMNCSGSWASFSNYGNPPVDFCAPGVSVCSTYKNGGYASLSGTSMAAPHAAGVYLATAGNPNTCGTVSGDPDGTADLKICK